MKIKSIAICVALSVMPFLNLAKAENALNLKQNDTVSGDITFGDLKFPLPDGAWTVVVKESWQGSVKYDGGWQEIKFPVVNVVLAQKDGKNLKKLARYVGNVEKPDITGHSWAVDLCKLDASKLYYKDSFRSRFEYPECLTVYPIYSFLSSGGAFWTDVRNWMAAENIKTPNTVIYVDYSKYTRKQFVHASVWVNPELAGFEPEKFHIAEHNGWYPANLDEKRKGYISSLVDWSKSFADNIHNSF